MSDIKIQWHPAFIAVMNLELIQNRNGLVFEKEHNLNTKPLEIDLLVIKKGVSIGYFFITKTGCRGRNKIGGVNHVYCIDKCTGRNIIRSSRG